MSEEFGGIPMEADYDETSHLRRKRTAAASKARHLNALRRKAPAMVEALRELGYTVISPEDDAAACAVDERWCAVHRPPRKCSAQRVGGDTGWQHCDRDDHSGPHRWVADQ